MSEDLNAEIQRVYDKNQTTLARGGMTADATVSLIASSATLLHAQALMKVAQAVMDAATLLTTPAVIVDSSEKFERPVARDIELQKDCDHVDAIERGVSSLMISLKGMGFEWMFGEAHSRSGFNVEYKLWDNGVTEEGLAASRHKSIDKLVNVAIEFFSTAWKEGHRFIVWRTSPEITSKDFCGEKHYKLYFRYHFLPAIPSGFSILARKEDLPF